MLVKILGLVDLIAGLILIFQSEINLPLKVALFFGMVLLLKSSLGMLKDFGSWIDFLGGILFLSSVLFSTPSIIGIIIGLLLIQKGIFSFIELF
ncbi:hypothetical protein J4481_01555 [Candidatus Pacearchaeota archaeon]|nr:hypothetical protein [Candidatus Pacearchaeota archaeon]